MFQYINSVLSAYQSTTIPDVPAESTSAEDPSTPVELCLQVGFSTTFFDELKETHFHLSSFSPFFKILCCLLGGGPIYGSKDAGGSGATLEQNAVEIQASLSDATNAEGGGGGEKQKAAKRSRTAGHVYSGSGEQLCEQTDQILPLLTAFCTSGLTAAYPPVMPSDITTSNSKAKRKKWWCLTLRCLRFLIHFFFFRSTPRREDG